METPVEIPPSLADRVCAYIRERGHVTFVELLAKFLEFRGDASFALHNPNIILWTGVSEECLSTVDSLLKDGRIHLWPAQTLTYLIDGGGLRLPIAKSARHYKAPHWLPVTFHHKPHPALQAPKMALRNRRAPARARTSG